VDTPLLLTLNGRERAVDAVASPATLDVVLQALELRADRVAVELNGELAPRAGWAQTEVKSGDRLEIVHFVGGGLGKV
jgi:sulfur carrier protein